MNKSNGFKIKFYFFGVLLITGLAFFGCGGSGGNSDWVEENKIVRYSNIRGRVIAPVNNESVRTSTTEAFFSLVSPAGTKVFIEDNSSLFAYTDTDGFFVIPNVPEGKHRVIANIVAGTTTYRQQSEVITVTGENETQEISYPIELIPALYNLKIHVSDITNSSKIAAKINVWGFSFDTTDGVADVGPFPSCTKSIEINISAIGYKDLNTFINFGNEYRSEVFVNMTPTSSSNSNRAPVVEIQHSNPIIKTNEEIELLGVGADPDGDVIQWKWTSNEGTFINDNNQTAKYISPSNEGPVTITLTGSDSKGASGKAVLNLNVQQSGSPITPEPEPEPEPANQPPYQPSNPNPANFATNVNENIVFYWTGGDPNNDVVTYEVYLATTTTKTSSDASNLTLLQTTNSSSLSYNGLEKDATYQWQVIAIDSSEAKTSSPIWSFSTIKTEIENATPSYASIVEPQNSSTDVSISQKLKWTATDENDDILFYDVYFGTESDPPLVSSAQPSQIYDPGTLQNGTTYYWRISVSDGKLANPKSDIWSFTTEATTDEKPFVVSISAPTTTNSPLQIVFSESIDKSKESEAFSFSPEVSGTWTWTSENTVAEFLPNGGSWLPGSYNKFTLAANVLEDTTGNKIENITEKKFDLPSSVPVPEGYHSFAFPMTLPANTTKTISIPDLASGKKSYVVAIAGEEESSSPNLISSQLTINLDEIIKKDPTYKLRLIEESILRKGIKIPEKKPVISISNPSVEIGDEKIFFLNEIATSTPYPFNKFTAKLTKKSEKTLVYIDESISATDKDIVAENVLNKFDNLVLEKVRDYFGNEPESGVDGENRISIVLINVGASSSLAGYFSSIDLFPRDEKDVYLRESNECKVFFIKYGMADTTTFGTLSHEFQHMINFYQRNQSLTTSENEYTWLNESLSKYSEEICGFSILEGDLSTTILVDYSMLENKYLSLTTWGPNTLYCYGQVYLFMHFLAYPGRYNNSTKAITKSLASGNGIGLKGYKNIEAVTNEPFKETMGKYALSLILNNYSSDSPTAYGLHNINLNGNYNNYQLSGYEIEDVTDSINLSDMPYENSVRFFRKSSNGSGDTNITISTGDKQVTLWLFDERD